MRRSIAYHDPGGVWNDGKIRLQVRTTYSEELARQRGRETRDQDLVLAPGRARFGYSSGSGRDRVEVWIDGARRTLTVDGSPRVTDADRERLRLRPAEFYRDYYEYLYGMPMKLRDPGANLDPEVARTTFQGREALALRVTYDPAVGADVWLFYFEPSTYAMIGYRFYKGGAEDSGEYIVLDGEVADRVTGFRIPESQSWYMNVDDAYLATDDVLEMTVEP